MNADRPTLPGQERLERRATQRLAADLSRFHKALEQIEQRRVDAGGNPAARPAETRGQEDQMRNYLACVDQCYQQLNESQPGLDVTLPTPRPRMRRV